MPNDVGDYACRPVFTLRRSHNEVFRNNHRKKSGFFKCFSMFFYDSIRVVFVTLCSLFSYLALRTQPFSPLSNRPF